MKIIMFYVHEFWWKPYAPTVSEAGDPGPERDLKEAVVVFYQVEAHDPDREKRVVEKLVKNIKWLCRKFETQRVIFHSFSHLSLSKAPPEQGKMLVKKAKEKLTKSGFELYETPYGWLNEWKMHVAGESLAKVFKEL